MASMWANFGLLSVLLVAVILFAASNLSDQIFPCTHCTPQAQTTCAPLFDSFGVTIPNVACDTNSQLTGVVYGTTCGIQEVACFTTQTIIHYVLFGLSFFVGIIFVIVLVIRLATLGNTPGKRNKKLLSGF